MKPVSFWIKRFLTVSLLFSVILLAVELIKGHSQETAISNSLIWGLISATIFTATRYYHASKNRACALCRDTIDEN